MGLESTHEPERNTPLFDGGAELRPLPADAEAARIVEGQSLRVVGLDAHPLLARSLRALLIRDRVEETRTDPLAAASRVEIEDEDLADPGLDRSGV